MVVRFRYIVTRVGGDDVGAQTLRGHGGGRGVWGLGIEGSGREVGIVGTLRLYTIERTAFRVERLSLKDRVLCFNRQVAKMAIPALWDQATY